MTKQQKKALIFGAGLGAGVTFTLWYFPNAAEKIVDIVADALEEAIFSSGETKAEEVAPRDARRDAVGFLHEKGMTNAEIAESFGIDEANVRELLEEINAR